MSAEQFACDKCGVVDVVDLAYPEGLPKLDTENPPPLHCSKCRTGEWHGLFERAVFRPSFEVVFNRPSNIGNGSS